MRQHRVGAGAFTSELKERDEVGAQPLVFLIGSAMCAADIVDEVKASQSFGEPFVSPEPGPTRILDDNIAVVLPGSADENFTYCEKPLVLVTFRGIIGTRVVRNRDESARNGDPENTNDPVADPSQQHALRSWTENVKCWSQVTIKGRGNPTTEMIDSRSKTAPP